MNRFGAHILLMVKRNFRSYGLLSVTIVLSFSFLLGLFVYTDSDIYNTNRRTFYSDPNSMIIFISDSTNRAALSLLTDRLGKMPNTYFYTVYSRGERLNQYSDESLTVMADVMHVPNNAWAYYLGSSLDSRVNIISGKSTLGAPDEAIVDKTLYEYLGGEGVATEVVLPVYTDSGERCYKKFKIVGVADTEIEAKQESPNILFTNVFISQCASASPDIVHVENHCMYVYSESISGVYKLCDSLGIDASAAYSFQNRAKVEIQNKIETKGVTALILFVLLGINLYSSFKNALNERRFEIGVKRALGADSKAIVRQFFGEGMVVLGVNIALSVLLVLDLAVIYKFVQYVFFDTVWTICLSAYSAAMFLVCAFFLSVFFSLLFAYQSTQVEIVKHLKQE